MHEHLYANWFTLISQFMHTCQVLQIYFVCHCFFQETIALIMLLNKLDCSLNYVYINSHHVH